VMSTKAHRHRSQEDTSGPKGYSSPVEAWACFMRDTKRNKDDRKNFRNDSDNFTLIDEPIDLSTQEEYLRFSETVDLDNVNYEEVLMGRDKLFNEDTSIETKKEILILLGHLGTPESCGILEKYLKNPEANLRDWALLSLKECRMFVEGVLLKQDGGFVSTGLGGKGNKLRYYFVVSSNDGLPFSETHRNTLINGFETISHKYRSQIEEVDLEATYAMIGMLIPMDIAVGEIIEEGISECNKINKFLFPDYYVTNIRRPTHKEILDYLQKLENGEE